MNGWRDPTRAEAAERITLTLSGIPDRLAIFLGLANVSCSFSLRRPIPFLGHVCFPRLSFCLLVLITLHIHAPFSLFPFHSSISLLANLLPILVALTNDLANRLEQFGELIAHVVGKANPACVPGSHR